MNRFPIWKGKRIGRYDDRLILRSVIFFALTVAALSVFTIWMTERNILLRIFLLFLITVLCLLDLFYKWKSGSMVDIRNRQAMSRMLLENRWFETEPLQRYRSGGRMERITYFPALYYRRKNRHIYVTVKITMGKYQDKLLHLEEKLETGLNCELVKKDTKDIWVRYEFLTGVEKSRIDIQDVKAENGELAFGTVDTWLIWNLTKGKVHATDYTNAARTMLFNIHTLEWDKELLEYFNIPENMLPQVKPSSCIYGETDKSVFGSSIIIAGAAGDQQSALFGQCCFNPGEVKNTYGTGCFLLMNTGNNPIYSDNGLLTTLAAGSTKDKPEYALEGSVFVAGAVVQWLRDELRMIKDAASTKEYAMKVENTAGVYIVPAFSGLGAPYWNPYARGTVVGLTRGTKKEHFIRAALESIAYQADDVIRAMEKSADIKLSGLKVDGGASANEFLMQFQSDITGESVIRPSCIETTALGAAYLAGLATGYWKDKDEIKKNWRLGAEYDARMSPDERRKLLKNWKHAVNSALFWAEAAEK